jgi:hypothetical protein
MPDKYPEIPSQSAKLYASAASFDDDTTFPVITGIDECSHRVICGPRAVGVNTDWFIRW